MKPWHRDMMAGAGLLCLLAAAYLLSLVLGLALTGLALIQIAFWLVPPPKEDNDGN